MCTSFFFSLTGVNWKGPPSLRKLCKFFFVCVYICVCMCQLCSDSYRQCLKLKKLSFLLLPSMFPSFTFLSPVLALFVCLSVCLSICLSVTFSLSCFVVSLTYLLRSSLSRTTLLRCIPLPLVSACTQNVISALIILRDLDCLQSKWWFISISSNFHLNSCFFKASVFVSRLVTWYVVVSCLEKLAKTCIWLPDNWRIISPQIKILPINF